jgi:hypothetical protein
MIDLKPSCGRKASGRCLKKAAQKPLLNWAGGSDTGTARMNKVFLLLFVHKRKPATLLLAALIGGSGAFMAVVLLAIAAHPPASPSLPLLLLTPAHRWFLYAIPQALLFAVTIALALARPRGAMSGHEPNPVSLRS